MPKLTIVDASGERHEIAARNGESLMQAAKSRDVPGIIAECGGACACATCHVYVDEAWRERAGPASYVEAATLEMAFDTRPASRLSCQITISPKLDGIIVYVPNVRG